MNGKEYRICASDIPSLLASEVTELLSQGWELYGHPFAGTQNAFSHLRADTVKVRLADLAKEIVH
jgi:hypothetical protein